MRIPYLQRYQKCHAGKKCDKLREGLRQTACPKPFYEKPQLLDGDIIATQESVKGAFNPTILPT
jgi:hypothetical protein